MSLLILFKYAYDIQERCWKKAGISLENSISESFQMYNSSELGLVTVNDHLFLSIF